MNITEVANENEKEDITEIITEVDTITDEAITEVKPHIKASHTVLGAKFTNLDALNHEDITDIKAVGDITVHMNVEKLTDCTGDLKRLEYYGDISYNTAKPEIQRWVRTDRGRNESDELNHDFIQKLNSELPLVIEPLRPADKVPGAQTAGACVLQQSNLF